MIQGSWYNSRPISGSRYSRLCQKGMDGSVGPVWRALRYRACWTVERLGRHCYRLCRSVRKPWGDGVRALLLLMASAALLACTSSGEDGSPTIPPRDATQSPLAQELGRDDLTSPATALPLRASPTATPPAPLAAIVNGEYIFLADLDRQMMLYEQALLGQGVQLDTEEGQLHLDEVRRDVLGSLIDYVLIRQEAAARNLSLSDDEVEKQLEADIAAGGGQVAFEEWLLATGQTREDYADMLRRSMLSLRVLESVTADVPVEVEQVHARHILADTEEAAQQILLDLRDGAEFDELAREKSVDLATKDAGGDLGWFPRGMIAPELEAVAFALSPGEVSEVVRVGEGYHIIQVIERELTRPLPPDLQGEYKLAVFDRWLTERRAAAAIEFYVDPQAAE